MVVAPLKMIILGCFGGTTILGNLHIPLFTGFLRYTSQVVGNGFLNHQQYDWNPSTSSVTKSFRYLKWRYERSLFSAISGGGFSLPQAGKHTAYIGEYLHFRYLKCLVIQGSTLPKTNILLMVQKCQTTTWDISNPVNTGIFTISTGDFWTINSSPPKMMVSNKHIAFSEESISRGYNIFRLADLAPNFSPPKREVASICGQMVGTNLQPWCCFHKAWCERRYRKPIEKRKLKILKWLLSKKLTQNLMSC